MPVRWTRRLLLRAVAACWRALLPVVALVSVLGVAWPGLTKPQDPQAAFIEAAAGRPAEIRAVWISNAILGRLGGPAGVQQLLDQLAKANFNVILPVTGFRGYTLYPRPYQDPRFAAWPEDPLTVIVR